MVQKMNYDHGWGRNAAAILLPVRNIAGCGNVNRMSQKSLTEGDLNFLLRMSAVVTGDCQFVVINTSVQRNETKERKEMKN
jgi:hypothetical protein